VLGYLDDKAERLRREMYTGVGGVGPWRKDNTWEI
jgi:hypothetical protein